MKLFTSFLKDELEMQIKNMEKQQDFMKGRSITDAVFMIKRISEKATEFVGDILTILMENKVPVNTTRTIHNVNTSNATKVESGHKSTVNVPTPGGIRHGDSLSLFLFNLPIEKIIKKATSLNLGYGMGDKTIGVVCYADDAAIIAQSENDPQRQLFWFFRASRQLNVNISTSKLKRVTIAKELLRCKLVMEDKPIEQVMQFGNLDVNTSRAHDPDKDPRSQISKAPASPGCLRDTVWSNPYTRTDGKIRIYKTCIRYFMTYGTEVREDTDKTMRRLGSCYRRSRFALGLTYRTRVTDRMRWR